MNPNVEVSISRTFEAEHSLPRVGAAERHRHAYAIECGYTKEIDFELGCARPLQNAENELFETVSRVEGKYLNDILPGPPTAEILACWILAQLPAHWEWIVVRAYDGFSCRVERKQLLPWLETLRRPATGPA